MAVKWRIWERKFIVFCDRLFLFGSRQHHGNYWWKSACTGRLSTEDTVSRSSRAPWRFGYYTL